MPKEIQGIRFYTLQEVALELDVTAQTIRAWIKQGKLKSQRIGRPILITEESLRDFLQPSK
jgi:excisionase family DNA binding protein